MSKWKSPRRVRITATQSDLTGTVTVFDDMVLTDDLSDAFELVKEELVREMFAGRLEMKPTEFLHVGPRGGRQHRFVGWQSIVWMGMCLELNADRNQPTLWEVSA